MPFAIDAESLAPDGGWTTAQQIACHKGLLETWQRIGILVHDGQEFQSSRIKASIDALPQKLLPLWQELLERLPVLPCRPEWDGLARSDHGCLDILSASAHVALLDDTKAEVEFGLAEADISKSLASYPTLEICRILAAAQAQTFHRAFALSGQHIPRGQTYQDLWQARFASLAKAPIKRISIVDRYAVSQHYECPQERLSGLARFLRLLDGDASGKRYVTLFSAWTHELNQKGVRLEDVQEEVISMLRRLPRGLVKQVGIVMLPNAVFGELHHGRFIRFEDYVWDIDIGIEVFEGPAVPRQSEAAFKVTTQVMSYREVERVLKNHAAVRIIEAKP